MKKRIIAENEIYSVSSYLEKVTGDYYIVPHSCNDDRKFIREVLKMKGLDSLNRSYPMNRVEEAIADGAENLVLVDCICFPAGDNKMHHDLRWYGTKPSSSGRSGSNRTRKRKENAEK